MILKHFPVEYQMDSQDCGPASLKIIAKHFGRYYSLQYLRDRCGITNQGISLLDLSTAEILTDVDGEEIKLQGRQSVVEFLEAE